MTSSEAIQHAATEFIRDRRPLESFVYGLLRDAPAAEDLLREVWVRLAAEVEKGTHLENQAAWCRGVARHLALRYWEKQRKAKVVASEARASAEARFPVPDGHRGSSAPGIRDGGRPAGLGPASRRATGGGA